MIPFGEPAEPGEFGPAEEEQRDVPDTSAVPARRPACRPRLRNRRDDGQ